MNIIETDFEDLLIIEPTVIGDERGYFYESYRADLLDARGINTNFVQDNVAKSGANIFRGLHYQLPPFAQAKLVRVIQGSVIDFVLDIRPQSKTYGQSFQIELSAANKRQFYVPRGFAHGYLSLEEGTIFTYKVDGYYNREHERGISYLDPHLDIQWPIDPGKLLVSAKDKLQPNFGNHDAYE